MILVIQIARGKAPREFYQLVGSAGQWPQLGCRCARPTQDPVASCRGVCLPTSGPLCRALGIFRVGREERQLALQGTPIRGGKPVALEVLLDSPSLLLLSASPGLKQQIMGHVPILESRGTPGNKEARARPAPHAQGQHLAFLLQGCAQVGPFLSVTSVSCAAS